MASTSLLPQLTEGVFAHKVDHYAILGAPLFANQEAVKQAYHRTAMALRSGLVERSAAGDQATQILAKMVNPAKQILLKTAEKTEYDTTLQLLGKKLSQEQPSLLRLVRPSPEIFRLIESSRLQEDYTHLILTLSSRTYTSLDQCGQVIHLISQINLAYLLLSSDSGSVYRASRPLISTHSQQNSLPGPELRQEAEAYARQAEQLIQQQQSAAALQSLNQAIRKDSTCIDFYLQRAFVQRQLGDLESARADYEQAIHLDPRHREARQGLQDILAALSAQFTQKIDGHRTTTVSTPPPRSQERPAVSAASSSPIDFHKEARKRFQEAERLIKRGLDQEAVYHLSIAIARDPKPEYYLLRARLNRKQDYLERAQADYDQVLRLDPEHPEALQELQQLRPTPAPHSHPRAEARKRYQQALELIDQELYEAAVQNLTNAISKDLNQVSYYLTRARVYRLMQEIELARGDYDQVIQMDPRNQEALQGLQEILQLSVPSRPRSSQSPPPSRRPTVPPEQIAAQLFQQAQELMGTKQEPKAVLLLSQAINADPHNIEYHLARARLCRKLGNLETARADYDNVILLDPHHGEALQGLRDILAASQSEEDTSPFSKPLSLKAKQEAQRRFQQALNIIDAENYKGAIQYLTLAIDKDPSVLEYYLTRARIHKLLNNLGMARADYKSVLKLDPDHQEARQGLKDTQAATQHPQAIPHQPKPKRFTVPDILFKEVFPSKKPSS